MDLTEEFESTFTGKHFTSDAEFESACAAFKESTGCRFSKRHMIYRQTPLVGFPNLLLKQGQFICSVSYCDAFFSVGSKKAGVYVTRFNMNHIHGPMPEETYVVKRDLLEEFRKYLPVDEYATFEDFHVRLQAFQNATGSTYVKRHTVRWPTHDVEKAHLVYARAHFECVNYGWSESNITSRPVNSKRIGCKAYVVIQTYKGWVEIFHLNMQHNHGVSRENMASQCLPSRRADHHQLKNNSYYPPAPVPLSVSGATSAHLSGILDKPPHEMSNFDPFTYPNLETPKQPPYRQHLKKVFPKEPTAEEFDVVGSGEHDGDFNHNFCLERLTSAALEPMEHCNSFYSAETHEMGSSRQAILSRHFDDIRRLAQSADLDYLAEMSRQLYRMEHEWKTILAFSSSSQKIEAEGDRENEEEIARDSGATEAETAPILLQLSSSHQPVEPLPPEF